jgi:hypothetical protein
MSPGGSLGTGTREASQLGCGAHDGSPGRMKPRRVYYLGLLGPATNGQRDITALYIARFGQPTPGGKIFVVTSQHKTGWRGPDHVSRATFWPNPVAG